MLVLSRRLNESLVIDGVIRVQVVEVSGNRVRLAIEAPHHIKILRGELLEADRHPGPKQSSCELAERQQCLPVAS